MPIVCIDVPCRTTDGRINWTWRTLLPPLSPAVSPSTGRCGRCSASEALVDNVARLTPVRGHLRSADMNHRRAGTTAGGNSRFALVVDDVS